MNTEYFLSINDVSKRLNLPAHTLRYWEKQFPSAIKPTTGAGGRRYYRAETVTTLESIKDLLYNRGLTIAGVKKIIRDSGTLSAPDFSDTKSPPMASAPAPSALFPNALDIDTAIDLLIRAKKELE